jgi:hypothetical protein
MASRLAFFVRAIYQIHINLKQEEIFKKSYKLLSHTYSKKIQWLRIFLSEISVISKCIQLYTVDNFIII